MKVEKRTRKVGGGKIAARSARKIRSNPARNLQRVRSKVSDTTPAETRFESGSKLLALHTLTRRSSAPEPPEAYGMRPACRRFSAERTQVTDSLNRTPLQLRA